MIKSTPCHVAAVMASLSALLVTGAAMASVAGAASYYVATSGDNGSPGTLQQPWRSLQHAAEQVKAGDTVFVRGGTYREGVELEAAGTARRPIKFTTYRNEKAVLDGKGAERSHGFNIRSNTTVDGFKIKNFRDYGVVGAAKADRLSLKNLTIEKNSGTGIRLWSGVGIRVQDVLLKENTTGGFDCSPFPGGAGCRRLRITRVHATENGTGNDTAVDAFAVEKGSDIVVRDSSAKGGPGDGFDFKSDKTTLRRVISLGTTRNGIKLWGVNSRLENSISAGHGMDGVSMPSGGSVTVINSLIANTRSYGYTAVFGTYNESESTKVKIKNTIFANAVPENGGALVYFSSGVKLTSDHNLYYDPYREDCVIDAQFISGETCFSKADIESGRWQRRSGQGEGSIYANPLFVSALSDFHLEDSSLAIDAGTSAGAPANGLECRTRPQVGAVDIGPYEKGGASGACGQKDYCSTATVGVSHSSLIPSAKRGKRATISRLKGKVKRATARGNKSSRKLRLVVRFNLSGTARVRVVVCRRTGEEADQKKVQVSRRIVSGKRGLNRYLLKAPEKRGLHTVRASVIGGTSLAEAGFRR